MTKRRSKESKFLTELRHSFEESGAFWHKLTDAPIFPGMKTRFNSEKPFDAILVYRGVPIAIEAKWLKDFGAFGERHLRQSQITGLTNFAAAGGLSYVFLNIRRSSNRAAGTTRLNSLLIFDHRELIGLPSIKKIELIEREQWQGRKQRYPVEDFLRRISTKPRFKRALQQRF